MYSMIFCDGHSFSIYLTFPTVDFRQQMAASFMVMTGALAKDLETCPGAS